MERKWIRFVESDEMYWFLAKNQRIGKYFFAAWRLGVFA